MEERMKGGRRKWKRGWWEVGGSDRENGGRKEEMEQRMVGGSRKWKRGWRKEG